MTTLPEKGLCAHRGGCETYPENTLATFREAIRLGSHMIEFDVRRSSDHQLFLFHDPDFTRFEGLSSRPEDLTLAELKGIDLQSRTASQIAGEDRIATMAEALKIMPMNIWLFAHVHYGDATVAEDVARMVLEHDHRLHQIILGTTPDKIMAARKVCPDILVCNMDGAANTPEYIAESIAIRANFVRFYSDKWIDKPLTPGLVAEARAAGIRCTYYEPENSGKLARLFEMGVNFPIVNYVGEMMKAAGDLGIQPVEPIFRNPIE